MEANAKRYRQLVAGEYASTRSWITQEALFTLVSGLKGALGYYLRLKLYPLAFKGIAKGTVIGCDVTMRCPAQLKCDIGVIIDDCAQLIGNSSQKISIELGRDTFLRSFAMLNSGPPDGYIRIGRNSSVGQSTIIYGNGGVDIGDNVMIAGQCFIVASSHNYSQSIIPMKEQGHSAYGISIGNNVWIGAGCKILDGVRVGACSVVAANSVVNKDVESGTIVGGVPAKVIGFMPS